MGWNIQDMIPEQNIQTSSGNHPASYLMGTRLFPQTLSSQG